MSATTFSLICSLKWMKVIAIVFEELRHRIIAISGFDAFCVDSSLSCNKELLIVTLALTILHDLSTGSPGQSLYFPQAVSRAV